MDPPVTTVRNPAPVAAKGTLQVGGLIQPAGLASPGPATLCTVGAWSGASLTNHAVTPPHVRGRDAGAGVRAHSRALSSQAVVVSTGAPLFPPAPLTPAPVLPEQPSLPPAAPAAPSSTLEAGPSYGSGSGSGGSSSGSSGHGGGQTMLAMALAGSSPGVPLMGGTPHATGAVPCTVDNPEDPASTPD